MVARSLAYAQKYVKSDGRIFLGMCHKDLKNYCHVEN